MAQLRLAFLKAPSTKNYLAYLSAISTYMPREYWEQQEVIDRARSLWQEKKYSEVLSVLGGIAGDVTFIVPSMHFLRARAYDGLGNKEMMGNERMIASQLLDAIEHSGDGTQTKPYRVLHLAAQRDVLDYVLQIPDEDRETVGVTDAGNKRFDVYQLRSGRRVWFDITEYWSILTSRNSLDRDCSPQQETTSIEPVGSR